MRREGTSLRTRIIAAIWAIAKGAGLNSDRVHEIGSKEIGRALLDGFGMTTCDSRELGRWLEAVKRAAGLPVLEYGPRTADRGPRRPALAPLRNNGEARASLEQYRLMENLKEHLHLGPEEFAGIAQKATQKPHSTALKDIQKIIEALKAIRRRRMRQAECAGVAVGSAAVEP